MSFDLTGSPYSVKHFNRGEEIRIEQDWRFLMYTASQTFMPALTAYDKPREAR